MVAVKHTDIVCNGCTCLTIHYPRKGCVWCSASISLNCTHFLIPKKAGGWSILLGGGWDWVVCRTQDGCWLVDAALMMLDRRGSRVPDRQAPTTTTLSTRILNFIRSLKVFLPWQLYISSCSGQWVTGTLEFQTTWPWPLLTILSGADSPVQSINVYCPHLGIHTAHD